MALTVASVQHPDERSQLRHQHAKLQWQLFPEVVPHLAINGLKNVHKIARKKSSFSIALQSPLVPPILAFFGHVDYVANTKFQLSLVLSGIRNNDTIPVDIKCSLRFEKKRKRRLFPYYIYPHMVWFAVQCRTMCSARLGSASLRFAVLGKFQDSTASYAFKRCTFVSLPSSLSNSKNSIWVQRTILTFPSVVHFPLFDAVWLYSVRKDLLQWPVNKRNQVNTHSTRFCERLFCYILNDVGRKTSFSFL